MRTAEHKYESGLINWRTIRYYSCAKARLNKVKLSKWINKIAGALGRYYLEPNVADIKG